MSDALTTYFETEYSKNWEMLAQQTDSRLGAAVTPTTITGKRRKFNQLDVGSMSEVTERKGDTPDGDSTGQSYWLYRRKFERVIVFDEDDEVQLGTIAVPNSEEVQSMTASSNRTKDDVIIQAFDATRYIGENGTTSDSFLSAMSIAVDYVASGSTANSGLTLAKIARAKKLLDEQEVEDGERYFVHAAQQLQDMLLVDKMTSEDYASVKALVDGKIDRFLGSKFIRSERLSRNTVDRCPHLLCVAQVRHQVRGRRSQCPHGRSALEASLPADSRRLSLRRCPHSERKVVRIYTDESP